MNPDLTRESTLKYERFAAAFSEALRAVALARHGGAWESRVDLLPQNKSQTAPPDHACVASVQLGGDLTGEILLSTSEEFAGKLCAQTEGTKPEGVSTAWANFLETSRQSLESALGALFGEVSIEGCRPAPATQDASALSELGLQSTSLGAGKVVLLAGAELRASLQRATINSPIASDMLPVGEGGHLHRVIDVPLAVTLRFGQRQLTLRELLALSTGSLLELDRQVEEPVDLMLGERIVARGEVVIVDGNYGMRVTQIVENASQRASSASYGEVI